MDANKQSRVNGLSNSEAIEKLIRLVRFPGKGSPQAFRLLPHHASHRFRQHNTHLSEEEIRKLEQLNEFNWRECFPADKPVFAPLEPTRDGGAVLIKDGQSSNIWAHRVAAFVRHGPAPEGATASHLMANFLGAEKDFNPNNLTWETDRQNKTRWFCADYANKMFAQAVDLEKIKQVIHPLCITVHNGETCKFWDPSWSQRSSLVRPKPKTTRRTKAKETTAQKRALVDFNDSDDDFFPIKKNKQVKNSFFVIQLTVI
jgi:hypothetical protein